MCIEREKQALLKFKDGLVDYANELSSWGSKEENCCKWSRVRCNQSSGHVSALDFRPVVKNEYGGTSWTPFRGEIRSSLVELQQLTYLDLSLFQGSEISIPKFIGSLKNLRYLNFSGCEFVGTIPDQLGNLSRLVSLDLSKNNFDKVESLMFLSHLPALENLDMRNTNLSQATDWLQAINLLPSLTNMYLSGCELSLNILPPPSLVNSSRSLVVIDLSSNNLVSSIFPGLFIANHSLPALKHINLAFNDLEGEIPRTFGNLSSLETMDLSQNGLTGELPDMKNSSSIREIYLSGNKLNGSLTTSIGLLSNLEILDLSSNFMDGIISDIHFLNLSKLWYLDISLNSLTLNFSPNWVPPFQLITLKMSSCKLGPHFPQWLQVQKRIFHLDISNAGISDPISDWFWDLPLKLGYLNLSSNQFSGEVQKLSSILGSMSAVDLSSNHFHGSLPLLPPSTTILDLSKNMFSGTTSNLCSITGHKLNYLDLSDNFLSGELPDCWMHWRYLGIINLANNNFSGTIPASFGLLPVETLSLRNNSFSGELPPALGNCTALELLDLGENRLSGEVPEWIGENLSSLIVLRLRSNHFIGTIPLHLCYLDSLQILDLSRNNISGSIPECLSNFTAMALERRTAEMSYTYSSNIEDHSWGSEWKITEQYIAKLMVVWKGIELEFGKNLGLVKSIDLSRNNLSGEIPGGITVLIGLVSLNFSHNQLTGNIPPRIGHLKLLESLDLSTNQLSGRLPEGLSDLNFLSRLNLSYNNFSGKIPRSTQLQSFDDTSFKGNPGLCGEPLPNRCPGEQAASPPINGGSENADKQVGKDEIITSGFFISMGIGFATGFWGVCCSLLLYGPWRHAYFQFLDTVGSWLYVRAVMSVAKLQSML
ncbi:hypothetical protein P3X46_010768 [Hevea brasiliensis]|uniref:Leucine-rich repeat-containing N-terminal plant-type domain-containing protein n=2 Tax=Hevea brasiliensis TaxID=3981 RepID=A0ABQ9MG91_HEVBR|nr:hypothetical protein P3X46_010768 [Hevea brasiliensis]